MEGNSNTITQSDSLSISNHSDCYMQRSQALCLSLCLKSSAKSGVTSVSVCGMTWPVFYQCDRQSDVGHDLGGLAGLAGLASGTSQPDTFSRLVCIISLSLLLLLLHSQPSEGSQSQLAGKN